MEQSLRVDIRALPGSLALDLQGDLTKQAEDAVLRLRPWDEGLEGQRKYLILNLTRVPYINSAGIAVLIRLARSGRKGGYQTFAFGVTAHYEKLFRMVGLTEYLMVYPDEYAVMERISALESE